MGKKLNEDIATINYDNLFYSDVVKAIPAGVTVASGQGKLKRGTLLAKNSENKMIVLGSDAEDEDVEVKAIADCVLTDEVDATSADADAIAYIQGNFNINELIVAEGYTISQADKDTLRTKNILIGRTLGY
jgi:hypothetical protein